VILDSAGQHFWKRTPMMPGARRRFTCEIDREWTGHWGGPNDGIVRLPIGSFEVTLSRVQSGGVDPGNKGSVRFANFTCEELPENERKPLPGVGGLPFAVRYTVTDFTPGDLFSGAPRGFCRTDTKEPLKDGCVEIDFGKSGRVDLLSAVPVWGDPDEFLLTVEAPAEAAGAEFQLALRPQKGAVLTNECWRLRQAVPTHQMIRQTFSVHAPYGVGWGICYGRREPQPKALPNVKHIERVIIRRGKAPTKKFRFRVVRLEAACRASKEGHPPLIAAPPAGDTAPREVEVGALNLSPFAWRGREVRVEVKDWSGRHIGEGRAAVPEVRPGERCKVKVPVPAAPATANFASYECRMFNGELPDNSVRTWTTSWTRPLSGPGSADLRPDLPWGMGVYMYRSSPETAFTSAYVTDSGAEGLARMEKRAALAQAAGIKWERGIFEMHKIVPSPGKYDFTFADKMVETAERHGITLYGLGSSTWPAGSHPYTPEGYAAWTEALRRCAERYKGRVKGWEIWNEPNIDFWKGPKEDYVTLLNMAYPAVKSADPSAPVVAFSTAGVALNFIDEHIGRPARFDAISIHPYRGAPYEHAFLADIAAITNRARGAAAWLSEIGWPTGCGPNTYSERRQASYYARAYLAAAGSGMVRVINGYDFVDDGFSPQDRENNFGVLRRDYTPKPAYRALAKVCRTFVEGRPSLEAVPAGDGLDVWIFRMGGKSAVWSTTAARLAVRTDASAKVTNLMDETVAEGSENAVIDIDDTGCAYFFDCNVIAVTPVEMPSSVSSPKTF